MKAPSRFVHVTPSVSRLAGGLFESVRHLSHSVQAASRAFVTVLALDDERTHEDRNCWDPLTVRPQRVIGPRCFGYSPGLGRQLFETKPDLVHLHGLWKYSCFAVRHWAVSTGRPCIVSPHGMLEAWALAQSKWRKRCAVQFYVGPCLRRAACVRATSEAEAVSIRRAGFANPIAIVPNGVRCPRQLPVHADSGPRTERRVLFLSRIHPKKGLLNLIQAWGLVRSKEWQLSIVGPNEANHLAEAKTLARELRLENTVHFRDEVWGAAKADLFLASDLFVLPSYSENFGLVIAEALAWGVPVITTRATPWQDLEQHQCGWWIDIGVEPLVAALKSAFRVPKEELRRMGRRGHDLVKRKYNWEDIGRRMLAVYEWMLSRTEKPDYVITRT